MPPVSQRPPSSVGIGPIRSLALLFLMFMGLAIWWNAGTVELEVSPAYVGAILEGDEKGLIIQGEGVMRLKSLIEQKAPATWLVGAILWQHFWYRVSNRGYDLAIRLTPPAGTPGLSYGLFQSKNVLYLEIDPIGGNRVLKADFTPNELMELVKPYLMTPDGRPY